jgi:hypothetical protein
VSHPCQRDGDDWLVHCYLQPRASRSEVVGEHDGALKIRLSAPPVDGAANTELCAFLAKQFGTSKTQVEIETGHTSRRKRVRVRGASRRPDFAG